MRDEKLILTEQPKHEFGDLDSNLPTNVMDLPDDWLDGLSDLIHEIVFIENDEEFDSRLKHLEPCPAVSLIQESVDPLGMYYPWKRTIKIDEKKIHRCTDHMQAQRAKATYDHLSKIITIHEESHALHHLAGDRQKNNQIWDKFGDNPSYVLEMLAQLFTYHEVASNAELLDAFYELEKRQPLVYHLWRLFKKCPKERLYWCIRDSYNCVRRIITILEQLGLLKTMKIGNRKKWQVAAGDTNRNYVALCLEWDVILNGPGSAGPWPDCRGTLENVWKMKQKKLSDIRRFCEDIKEDHIIILHVGTKDVYGVGVVVGEYEHNEEFGDIDDWELQHIRRVRWIWKCDKQDSRLHPKSFDTYTLKWGDTVQEMTSPTVINWIEDLPVTDQDLHREIETLPPCSREVSIDEISGYLFDEGVAGGAIASFTGEIDELIGIARWYERAGGPATPSEAETISYLVIPLLRGLGWTPQKMAIEWNKVDVALFSSLPRDNKNLLVVVEAKPKDFSCLNYDTKSQAQCYAEEPGRETCKRLIVTDGIRYAVYSRDKDNKFPEHPDAYLNLTRMREAYPLLHWNGKCGGAKEAFLYMSAYWNK